MLIPVELSNEHIPFFIYDFLVRTCKFFSLSLLQ